MAKYVPPSRRNQNKTSSKQLNLRRYKAHSKSALSSTSNGKYPTTDSPANSSMNSPNKTILPPETLPNRKKLSDANKRPSKKSIKSSILKSLHNEIKENLKYNNDMNGTLTDTTHTSSPKSNKNKILSTGKYIPPPLRSKLLLNTNETTKILIKKSGKKLGDDLFGSINSMHTPPNPTNNSNNNSKYDVSITSSQQKANNKTFHDKNASATASTKHSKIIHKTKLNKNKIPQKRTYNKVTNSNNTNVTPATQHSDITHTERTKFGALSNAKTLPNGAETDGESISTFQTLTLTPSIAIEQSTLASNPSIEIAQATLASTLSIEMPHSTLISTLSIAIPHSALASTNSIAIAKETLASTPSIEIQQSTLASTPSIAIPQSTLASTTSIAIAQSTLAFYTFYTINL